MRANAITAASIAPAPSSTPRFTEEITASDVNALTKHIVADYRSALDACERSKGSSWEASFGATLEALGRASAASAAVTLPAMTHGDQDVRKRSTIGKDVLKAMFDETFTRRGVYEALKNVGSEAAPSDEASTFCGNSSVKAPLSTPTRKLNTWPSSDKSKSCVRAFARR
jgi:hypothetical protein